MSFRGRQSRDDEPRTFPEETPLNTPRSWGSGFGESSAFVMSGEETSGGALSCGPAESLQVATYREESGPVELLASEFPALPSPAASNVANGNLGTVETVRDEDADLRRALEESMRFACSTASEDPALKRAMEESKADLVAQQARLFEEFEQQKTQAELERKTSASNLSPCEPKGVAQPDSVNAPVETESPNSNRGQSERKPKGKHRLAKVDAADVLGFSSQHDEVLSQNWEPNSITAQNRVPAPRYHENPQSQSRFEAEGSDVMGCSFSQGSPHSASVKRDDAGEECADVKPVAQVVEQSKPDELGNSNKVIRTKNAKPRQKRAVRRSFNVILDGESIGFCFGRGVWKARGIELAVNYFREKGHEVLATLPAFLEQSSSVEDRQVLQRLRERDSKVLWANPSSRSYRADVLDHAVNVSAQDSVVLVSNCNFAREVRGMQNAKIAEDSRNFLRAYRLTFTWTEGCFRPQDFPLRLL